MSLSQGLNFDLVKPGVKPTYIIYANKINYPSLIIEETIQLPTAIYVSVILRAKLREEKIELDGQHHDSSGATNQNLRTVGPRSKEVLVARHDTQPRKREGTWIDKSPSMYKPTPR